MLKAGCKSNFKSDFLKRNRMKLMRLAGQAASLLLASTLSISALAELVVEEGYVRKPIPGRSMSAAFMTVRNTGTEDFVVTSACLEGAESVEIHTHSHDDGVMRMRQLHELTIKAGEAVTLEPGGLHLMIFGIKELPESPELNLCNAEYQCFSTSLSIQSLVNK
jgi:copper(I)-binding protein